MTHEQNHNQTPTLQQVAGAYSEILEHNRTNAGFGGAFRGLLGALIENAEVVSDEEPDDRPATEIYASVNESLQEGVVRGDMAGEMHQLVHEDVFIRVGIQLRPNGRVVSGGDEERISSDKLSPFITSPELYKDFLATLSPEDIEQGGDNGLLFDAALNLRWLIFATLSENGVKDADEHGLEAEYREAGEDALRMWAVVEDEYARLGLSAENLGEKAAEVSPELKANMSRDVDPHMKRWTPELHEEHRKYRELRHKEHIFDDLENSVKYWGDGLLQEYLTVSANGYLITSDDDYNSGPSRFAIDHSPETITEYWENAFDFAERLSEKDQKGELASAVRANLIKSLEESLAMAKDDEHNSLSAYDKAIEEWRAHGEEPYDIVWPSGSSSRVWQEPKKSDFDYSTNRLKTIRQALEAAQLRLM